MISLRCSKAKDWLTCSRMAAHHEASQERSNIQHVRTLVGILLHNKVTGQDVTMPDFVEFDDVTRTAAEMHRQVDGMYEVVLAFMRQRRWEVSRREIQLSQTVRVGDVDVTVAGALDLICVQDYVPFIVDLKSGKTPPAKVFLQLALYAWLAHEHGVVGHQAVSLWIGRKYPHPHEYVVRDCVDLVPQALDIIRQRAAIEERGTAATPGPHCRYCRVEDCALRDGEFPDPRKRKIMRLT